MFTGTKNSYGINICADVGLLCFASLPTSDVVI